MWKNNRIQKLLSLQSTQALFVDVDVIIIILRSILHTVVVVVAVAVMLLQRRRGSGQRRRRCRRTRCRRRFDGLRRARAPFGHRRGRVALEAAIVRVR